MLRVRLSEPGEGFCLSVSPETGFLLEMWISWSGPDDFGHIYLNC